MEECFSPKKIVTILDAADRLKRKDQQLIDKYNALSQSLFLDMFGDLITNKNGYAVQKLSEVIDVRDGTHDSPKYVASGYPLVTSKNIKDGTLDLSTVNYISEEDYFQIQKRSSVSVGDIIMPMIGTIGNLHHPKVPRHLFLNSCSLFSRCFFHFVLAQHALPIDIHRFLILQCLMESTVVVKFNIIIHRTPSVRIVATFSKKVSPIKAGNS